MKIFTFNNLPYLAAAIVEAYFIKLGICYGIRGILNEAIIGKFLFGLWLTYFLIPVFLSGFLKKHKILWTPLLYFSIISGMSTAVSFLILYLLPNNMEEIFPMPEFFRIALTYLFIGVLAAHFLLGLWSIVVVIFRAILHLRKKSEAEPVPGKIKESVSEPLQVSEAAIKEAMDHVVIKDSEI